VKEEKKKRENSPFLQKEKRNKRKERKKRKPLSRFEETSASSLFLSSK